MNVGLGNLRQIVVDHVRDAVDVDAARGDVGRDEHVDLVRFEPVERLRARVLALVAVNRRGGDVGVEELSCDAVGRVLHLREDDDLERVPLLDQVDEQLRFVSLLDETERLGNAVDGWLFGLDRDLDRVVHERS